MTSKTLNKLYNKAKVKYLAEIQNDDGSYTCPGCGCNFFTITIHHIIKRSKLKYYYADSDNFVALCGKCHHLAEGTIEQQMKLNCYHSMMQLERFLLDIYYSLKPYEQTLNWKYE